MRKAVVLARGLGKRMREANSAARLDAQQSALADTGLKAMIPVGRPFLDYSLSALADAGYEQVCVVIGPEHENVRRYYTVIAPPRRVQIHFAVQREPRGTADAVLAAEEFVGGEEFLSINSDNYYPVSALRDLRLLDGPAVALFEADRLIAEGIPCEKILKFAICEVSDGYLEKIVEKPSEEVFASKRDGALISLNCWRFGPFIFDACRRVPLSPRGEYELPKSVELAIQSLGARFRVVQCAEGALDLSSRTDVPSVTRKLASIAANP